MERWPHGLELHDGPTAPHGRLRALLAELESLLFVELLSLLSTLEGRWIVILRWRVRQFGWVGSTR